MSKGLVSARDIGAVRNRNVISADEVRHELRRVVASPMFHGSKRCQQFLEYVCERQLAGESEALKERIIAIEVFGRHSQTDLGDDTIVRVSAREVRKRLAQFYVTPEGTSSPVRLDLPPGSYAPEFRRASAPPREEAVVPQVVPIAKAGGRRWPRRRVVILGGSAVVLMAAAVLAVVKLSASPNLQAFQQFWNPVFRAADPLAVVVAHPLVYHPSRRALKLNEEGLPPQRINMQRALHLPPEAVNGADLIPVYNQYVGFGDMVAVSEVSAMLARHGQNVRVRMASGTPFADLRRAPALLIGSITNRWTMELQQNWRFRFSWTPGEAAVITDSQKPAGGGKARQWAIPASDDGTSLEDYIVICRIRNSPTGGMTMAAAGLKQFGTEAAGRLLADPDQLGAILRKLRPGWESRNLQVVLHARVIGNTPAQPEVEDWQVW